MACKVRRYFGTAASQEANNGVVPLTLISLINVEVGINVEGVQKMKKSLNVEGVINVSF